MKGKWPVLSGSLVFLLCLMVSFPAKAQEERTGLWTAGAGLGLQGGTADGSAFAINLAGDYFLTHNFSVGPLVQLGFTGDLFQIGVTAQAKYTLDLIEYPRLKPHFQGGIGFIHADLQGNDTSFLIPLGVGAEYRLGDTTSLESSLLFNFTDLDVDGSDSFFITWTVGVRFQFR